MANTTNLRLSAFFTARDVLTHLEGVSRDDCLRALINRLAEQKKISNPSEVFEAVLQRERLLPTHLVPGLAVPHTRLVDINTLILAVATSRDGIDFDHGATANVIVLILTPVSQPGLYLQSLAGVATLFAGQDSVSKATRLAKPEQVWEFFDKGDTTLPQYVTARDVMTAEFTSLRTADYLERAIDLFAYERLFDIPVIDEDGDLAGILTEEELLRLALPEYILWLQDLSPILQFEPFAEITRNERALRVAEVMSTEYATVPEDAPAIQVARVLMQRDVRAVMVTRGKKLVGVITLSDFLTRILRR